MKAFRRTVFLVDAREVVGVTVLMRVLITVRGGAVVL